MVWVLGLLIGMWKLSCYIWNSYEGDFSIILTKSSLYCILIILIKIKCKFSDIYIYSLCQRLAWLIKLIIVISNIASSRYYVSLFRWTHWLRSWLILFALFEQFILNLGHMLLDQTLHFLLVMAIFYGFNEDFVHNVAEVWTQLVVIRWSEMVTALNWVVDIGWWSSFFFLSLFGRICLFINLSLNCCIYLVNFSFCIPGKKWVFKSKGIENFKIVEHSLSSRPIFILFHVKWAMFDGKVFIFIW